MSEVLWSGEFGDEYLERNPQVEPLRQSFWKDVIQFTTDADRFLEIGCGAGINLQCLRDAGVDPWGCDVNKKAVERSRQYGNVVQASGYDLPFRDDWFDFVFTAGVLIHQQPKSVKAFCREVVRVSKTYVMAMEYHSPEFHEIEYRGRPKSLWSGPYDRIYEEMGLQKIEAGFLPKEAGWDDVTWWLFLVNK